MNNLILLRVTLGDFLCETLRNNSAIENKIQKTLQEDLADDPKPTAGSIAARVFRMCYLLSDQK